MTKRYLRQELWEMNKNLGTNDIKSQAWYDNRVIVDVSEPSS